MTRKATRLIRSRILSGRSRRMRKRRGRRHMTSRATIRLAFVRGCGNYDDEVRLDSRSLGDSPCNMCIYSGALPSHVQQHQASILLEE
jgi:hypothetical protein